MTGLLAGALAALAVLAAARPRPRPALPRRASPPAATPRDDRGWLLRGRPLWAVLAAVAGATFVSGPAGLGVGLVAGVVTWVFAGRAESPVLRRAREASARDLPGLVHLLGTALESGCGVAEGVRLVCDAYPGPAAGSLSSVPARLALGVDPADAWSPVLADPVLAPLARAMVRAHRSGSSVVDEVIRLADELGDRARQQREERARTVGVRAAVPLGLCLLPAFVLTGVVPLVAALLRSLAL